MTLSFDEFVLAASTADLAEEPAARPHADAVEFRMDLAASPAEALAAYEGELPLLVTNRVAWEGGEAPDAPERIERLRSAVEHPAVEAVDVELDAIDECQPVVEHARENGVAVVVSTHDFEGTPSRERIDELLERACDRGDVGKLAVTANARGDVLDVLAATHERTAADDTVATMAMGEAGRHSRAVAPLYGSRIGYAPVAPENATAPGQYPLGELRSLVDSLAGSGT